MQSRQWSAWWRFGDAWRRPRRNRSPARWVRPPPPPPRAAGSCRHRIRSSSGVIKERALESTPWWAPRVVPPKGAPNVLLMKTDDSGFGAPGTFGGVVPTPALDRIANAGLRYTNFHSTSLCSPTRAALITGRNHHVAGFGVDGGDRDRLSTAMTRSSWPGERHGGHDPEGERLRHLLVWQEPQHAVLPGDPWRGRSTSGRSGWASSTSMASSAAMRASGSPTCSATRPRSFPSRAIPAGTARRPWPTRPSTT